MASAPLLPNAPTTESFVAKFHDQHNPASSIKWVHDHPTTIKVIQIVALIVGLAAVAFAALQFASFKFLPPISLKYNIAIVSFGGLLTLASLLSTIFLSRISKTHDIQVPVYPEAMKEGRVALAYPKKEGDAPKVAGRLYYRGNIPILELDDADPFEAGRAHGYLLGAAIHSLKSNLVIWPTFLSVPHPKILAEVRKKIPQPYIDEMRGLSEGYNEWAKEQGISKRLTPDDVLLLQLISDSTNFDPDQWEKVIEGGEQLQNQINAFNAELQRPENSAVPMAACTSLLYRDPKEGVTFGRNMDWLLSGDGGEKSLIIVWKHQKIAALGFPGLIGVVTGWNSHGLSLSMNVCPTGFFANFSRVNGKMCPKLPGMPAILFNRELLSHAHSVDGTLREIQGNSPLVDYNMTVADSEEQGASVLVRQMGRHFIRLLDQDPRTELEVLNWEYPRDSEVNDTNSFDDIYHNKERHKILRKYFRESADISDENLDSSRLMEGALQLAPHVNSLVTLQSLIFRPKLNRVDLSWDNGYAATMARQTLEMDDVFNN